MYKPQNKEELLELVNDESIYLGDIDTSLITDMSYLFDKSKRKDFSGIEKWDTSNVEDMNRMFCEAKFFNQPLSEWNTSNVRDMSYMFNYAESFNQPLDKWNVSNVENMKSMFAYTKYFNQPLNSWDTSNVKNMNGMFFEANKFNQPLNEWNTSKVKNMCCMFYSARAFNQSLDKWNVSNVKDMESMFNNALSFNQPLNEWNVSNVEFMRSMFYLATSFNQPLDSWNVSKVYNMSEMFKYAKSFNQPLDKWNVSNVKYMKDMFRDAESFNQPLEQWNTWNTYEAESMKINSIYNDKNIQSIGAFLEIKNRDCEKTLDLYSISISKFTNAMLESMGYKEKDLKNSKDILNLTEQLNNISQNGYNEALNLGLTNKVFNNENESIKLFDENKDSIKSFLDKDIQSYGYTNELEMVAEMVDIYNYNDRKETNFTLDDFKEAQNTIGVSNNPKINLLKEILVTYAINEVSRNFDSLQQSRNSVSENNLKSAKTKLSNRVDRELAELNKEFNNSNNQARSM